MKNRLKLFIMAAALICIGAASYFIICHRTIFPKWTEWENGTFYDQSGQYMIVLRRKSIDVIYDDEVTWSSPEGVKVQQALSCDIDNDGDDELILLCWKIGRFDSVKPFWIEEDEKEWSQHIFVYEYGYDIESKIESGEISAGDVISTPAPGEIRPKWMSSYIGQDVAKISSNGQSAPSCRLLLTAPDGQVSTWVWDSWGFTKENAPGQY